MSFAAENNAKQLQKLKREIDILRDNVVFSPSTNDLTPLFANLGGRNAAHGPQTGLETSIPIVHLLTDVDDNGTSTGAFDRIDLLSSNIIVDRVGFTSLNLKYIQKRVNDGTKLKITVKSGKSLTFKTGGDIAIDADVTINDKQFAYVVYYSDTTKFKLILTSSVTPAGDFANKTLSNLDSPTAINQHLLPNANNLREFGSITLAWKIAHLLALNIPTGGSLVTSSFSMINDATLGGSVNIPNNKSLLLYENGVEKVRINSTLADFSSIGSMAIKNAIITYGLFFNDGLIDPIITGEIRRKGNDLLAFSGGAVRNFSDIGMGANRNLSNLLDPTSINQNLIPDAHDTREFGSLTLAWKRAVMLQLLLETGGLITTNKFSLTHNATLGGEINVPSGKSLRFYVNGIRVGTLDSSKLDVTDVSTLAGTNIIVNNSLQFNDGITDPTVNGEMKRVGTHVKVFSDGAVRNLSAIASSSFLDTEFEVKDDGNPANKIKFQCNLLSGIRAITWLNRSGKPILIDSITDNVEGENKRYANLADPVDNLDAVNYQTLLAKIAGSTIFDTEPDLESFIMPTNWSIGYTGVVVPA